MKKYIVISCVFLVGLLIAQCKRYSDPALVKFNDLDLMFPDSAKDSVVHEMTIMDELMKKIADRGKFTTHQIGYIRNENSLFFRHCLPKEGRKYVLSDRCNVDSLLSVEERQTLSHGIEYLKSVSVRGCYHEPIFNKIIFIVDVPAKDVSDRRFLCLTTGLDTAFVRKTSYKIIQQAAGLTLLQQHY